MNKKVYQNLMQGTIVELTAKLNINVYEMV
jgi:hypothetical protein